MASYLAGATSDMTSTGSKGAGQGMKGTREELPSSDSDDRAASLACGRPVDWSLVACLLLEGSLVPRRSAGRAGRVPLAAAELGGRRACDCVEELTGAAGRWRDGHGGDGWRARYSRAG
ncbi:hypothetical protein OsI_23170 [Oryza sativa Indica Group]|uniref:Uncharacterized protein n=1 Tax=Oryza sativa subsp. indica TaxID=39946 RepID=B8B342_ORYSI|nr:hypothetical protein OsI_23170 [Oryza sativa Indica Group]